MGRAFKEIGAPRSSYYLATKVSEANLEPKKLREHLEASLARLQTDYVDCTEPYPEPAIPLLVLLHSSRSLSSCSAR